MDNFEQKKQALQNNERKPRWQKIIESGDSYEDLSSGKTYVASQLHVGKREIDGSLIKFTGNKIKFTPTMFQVDPTYDGQDDEVFINFLRKVGDGNFCSLIKKNDSGTDLRKAAK